MYRGTIIDVSGRKARVFIESQNISTPFIETTSQIDDKHIKKGNIAIVATLTGFYDSVIIGVM